MKITDETLESLRQELERLEPSRQHGRVGVALADSEAEKRRLYNNLASRLSRARKKLREQELAMNTAGVKQVDDFGITDVDIRRYKKCYVYENVIPDRLYIKTMTGLDDIQINELERRIKENELVI